MEHNRIEVPPGAVAGSCEDRSSPRFTLLIRAAKLIAPTGEFIAVIRDVSESGISLRGFHQLPAGEPLVLELQTGERHRLAPVWGRGNEAGYRFLDEVDIVRLVAEAGRYPKRQLRLNMSFQVELAFLGRRIPAEVTNVSQQGAGIICGDLLAIQQPLRIISDKLPEVRARVRWRKGDGYGLAFDDTFSLSQLAVFAATAQDAALLGAPECAVSLRR
ncbi:PilZ domain protein [Tsuneonella dongtanensis]|uniref:PilZ domain protein n=1 Tax=Tsuneonella dongtanensis TaxID=692370 RepID=A0A1B2AAI6_9SPHN|nr:PilZ domain-containing protein [Tsuneonella dongtanensis]ANY19177.1 PilZ domain protein [Tsuneonella dongtanensis]